MRFLGAFALIVGPMILLFAILFGTGVLKFG